MLDWTHDHWYMHLVEATSSLDHWQEAAALILQPERSLWCDTAVLSTVLRKLFTNPKYKRQLLTAPDGGVFAIDWFRASNKKKRIASNVPVVLVAHALCGGLLFT